MATSITCVQNPCRLPIGCMTSTATKCVYYSGSAIPFMSIYSGSSLDVVITNISNYIGSLTGIPVIVETYADMIEQATGEYYKRFMVLNDENKNAERIVYEYWPTIGIIWIVTVDEVIE